MKCSCGCDCTCGCDHGKDGLCSDCPGCGAPCAPGIIRCEKCGMEIDLSGHICKKCGNRCEGCHAVCHCSHD